MVFTLQLLHAADQEAGIPAIEDAPNFSAVLNALRTAGALSGEVDGQLTLSSGDAYIPGPFFNASSEVFGAVGRGDILIQNELGFEAIAFGNHEFDLGTGAIADIIAADSEASYPGANFPYLSTNLDFSNSGDLASFVVDGGAAPQPATISSSVVINEGGIEFGIVGATTPTLGQISSPGDVGVLGTDGIDDLAAVIQEEIDALTSQGINHIILLAHMQQISVEQQLAERLEGVDIIIAGGSNTLLADSDDVLRAGDVAEGEYPIIITTDENGAAKDAPTVVVNTDGNYRYVGQLIVTFDDAGEILPNSINPLVNGAFATDDAGLVRLSTALGTDISTLIDPEVQDIVDSLAEVIADADGSIFGSTDVFLNGTRDDVRTQETNLGNLTADANLFVAKQTDPTVQVSLKNGGGIRDNIGVITFPPGSTDPEDVLKLPTQANPLAGKEEGDISQLDVANSLRFNNGLTLLTVTALELKQLLEHGLAETVEGETPGRFPQVGGMSFSFDASQTAIEIDDAGNVITEGQRVRNLVIEGEDGRATDIIVRNGELVGNPNREIRMVTLNFLAGGGDGYPFPSFGEDVEELTQPEEAPRTGAATDAVDGSEQDALAEYLAALFSTTPFSEEDTDPENDFRIQNVAARDDAILDRRFLFTGTNGSDRFRAASNRDSLFGEGGNDFLFGLEGDDRISGGDGNDRLSGGNGSDRMFGGDGADRMFGNDGNDAMQGGAGNDQMLGLGGNDRMVGGPGNDRLIGGAGDDFLLGGVGRDRLFGRDGDDRLDGGADVDFLFGGAGVDRFILSEANGRERIRGFVSGEDKLVVSGVASFDDIELQQQGRNTLVQSTDGIRFALLLRTQADSLSAGDFNFA